MDQKLKVIMNLAQTVQMKGKIMETSQTVQIITVGDLVEENGKTIRENNLAKQHALRLGDVVEVDIELSDRHGFPTKVDLRGKCRLYVVAHMRDCDGTPLYMVSDLPVAYPLHTENLFSKERLLYRMLAVVVEHGYSEESLKATGEHNDLCLNLREYLGSPD